MGQQPMRKQTNIELSDMENRVYLDTNIVLDLLLKKRQNHQNSLNTLANYIKNDYLFATNNLNLNTTFYVGAEKNNQYENTKQFLLTIENSQQWIIYNLTTSDRHFAYKYMEKHFGTDFEDLQQYISAKNSKCQTIITNDKHFPQLNVPLKRTDPHIKDYQISTH